MPPFCCYRQLAVAAASTSPPCHALPASLFFLRTPMQCNAATMLPLPLPAQLPCPFNRKSPKPASHTLSLSLSFFLLGLCCSFFFFSFLSSMQIHRHHAATAAAMATSSAQMEWSSSTLLQQHPKREHMRMSLCLCCSDGSPSKPCRRVVWRRCPVVFLPSACLTRLQFVGNLHTNTQ